MQFDATTFLFEIVNFLALVWLLTHFLYRPVHNALDARVQARAREDAEVASRRAELERQQRELADEKAAVQARREAAQGALAAEIAAKREQQLAALGREVEAERVKRRVLLEQEQAIAARSRQDELRRQSALFVGRYLARLASPAVEAAVIELFLGDLASQAPAAQRAFRAQGSRGAPLVEIATAFDLAPELRARIEGQLAACCAGDAVFRWQRDPALLAGLRVQVTGHRLEASLARGVDAFAAEAAP